MRHCLSWTERLRALAGLAPAFEFNSLRKWLSLPGQFEQLMGNGNDRCAYAGRDRLNRANRAWRAVAIENYGDG
jgi:hypothetical protein